MIVVLLYTFLPFLAGLILGIILMSSKEDGSITVEECNGDVDITGMNLDIDVADLFKKSHLKLYIRRHSVITNKNEDE